MSKIEFEFDIPAALPDGWKWLPLEELMDSPKQDIVDGPFGSNLKASEYVDEGVPIARLQNVDRNAFVHKNIKYVTRKKADELSRHTFKPGDILITKLGDPLGEACIAPSSIEQGVIVADLVRVRPAEKKVDRRYLTYAINSPLVARQFEKHTKGTTRPRVNLGMIRQLPIPVAPRDMQAGVVAEIEKQFSRLDEAVANLKRVKANLKRYKAAVLKAAVEGRLVETEAERARREGRSYETGVQLLQRILETRRSQWQGKGKYKEPAAPDTTDLPELPEGWAWATVEQMSSLVEYGTSAKTSEDSSGVPVLRMGNIVEGELRLDELKYLPANHDEFPKLLLKPGDLLFNRTNSPELVGKTAVFAGSLKKCSFASYLIRVRLVEGSHSKYIAAHINSSHGRTWVKSVVTQQVGQANVNGTKLQALTVPLPPEVEQHRICSEMERRLSLIRETDSQMDANLQRAEQLRRVLLSKAFFSGE
jgi:type I restriction enzyme, S subunit